MDALVVLILKTARTWAAMLTAVVFAYLLGFLGPELERQSGGLANFDARILGYSNAEAEAYLSALTENGKAFYLTEVQGFDRLFPPMLMLALILMMQGLRGVARLAWAVPVLYCIIDLAENARIREILLTGLPTDPHMIATASFLTMAKFVFVTASFGLAAGAYYLDLRARRFRPSDL